MAGSHGCSPGMWEFRTGNTFGAVAFTSFGAFWMSCFVLVQFFAKEIPAADVGHAVGLYFIAWGVFTAYMFVASLRTSIAVALVFGLLVATFFLLGIRQEELAGFTGPHQELRVRGPSFSRRWTPARDVKDAACARQMGRTIKTIPRTGAAMAESPNHDRPPRPSASAEGAAVRWSETHPDEDVPHVPPSTPPESEDVVPNRHSASAEAAALRLREREDDSEN